MTPYEINFFAEFLPDQKQLF